MEEKWYSFVLKNEHRNDDTMKWLNENIGKDDYKINVYGTLNVYGEANATAVKLRWT